MENASKALLIAGGILIAMLTISVFYIIFNRLGEMTGNLQADYNQKELVAFNTAFEAYNKKLMYGADVLSVLNKAIDNNIRYDMRELDTSSQFINYYVNIQFTYNGRTYNLRENYSEIKSIFLDNISKTKEEDSATYDFMHTFKFSGFRCRKVNYVTNSDIRRTSDSNAVGRVKEMIFEKV